MRSAIFLAALSCALLIGCGPEDEGMLEAEGVEELGDLQSDATYAVCTNRNNCNNCVDFARCRQPKLPHGLTYWREKVARINSPSGRVGCVAMIYTGNQWGHVAYVSDVDRSREPTRFTIQEGNWPSGQCGVRRGSRDALNIRGFWCP